MDRMGSNGVQSYEKSERTVLHRSVGKNPLFLQQ